MRRLRTLLPAARHDAFSVPRRDLIQKAVNMATTTLYVDQDLCTGCETCVETCPGVFKINEEGLSEVQNPAGASAEDIQEAIDGCPSGAIKNS